MYSGTPGIHLSAAKGYDKSLLFVMLALLVFGTIMIYSSTAVVTPLLEKKNISEFYYIKRHMLTMVLGTIALFAAYKIKPRNCWPMALRPARIGSLTGKADHSSCVSAPKRRSTSSCRRSRAAKAISASA